MALSISMTYLNTYFVSLVYLDASFISVIHHPISTYYIWIVSNYFNICNKIDDVALLLKYTGTDVKYSLIR